MEEKQHKRRVHYSGKYPNQYEHNQKYQGAISLNIKGDFQIKPSLFWLKAIDHYQLIKNTDFGENYHMTDVYGSTINVSKKWKSKLKSHTTPQIF